MNNDNDILKMKNAIFKGSADNPHPLTHTHTHTKGVDKYYWSTKNNNNNKQKKEKEKKKNQHPVEILAFKAIIMSKAIILAACSIIFKQMNKLPIPRAISCVSLLYKSI